MPWGRAASSALVFAVVVALCGLPGGAPNTAEASVVRALSLGELTYRASDIVIAVPTEQRARKHLDGKLIVTDFSLRVEDVLKGGSKPGETTIATVLGGKLDGLALQVPGEANFELGERALVFLYRAERSGDLRVVGMSQGVLPVRYEGATQMVIPGGAGAALVEQTPGAGMTDAQPALSEPQPLGDVVRRIRALVAKQSAR